MKIKIKIMLTILYISFIPSNSHAMWNGIQQFFKPTKLQVKEIEFYDDFVEATMQGIEVTSQQGKVATGWFTKSSDNVCTMQGLMIFNKQVSKKDSQEFLKALKQHAQKCSCKKLAKHREDFKHPLYDQLISEYNPKK